jgi:hypothetical protein
MHSIYTLRHQQDTASALPTTDYRLLAILLLAVVYAQTGLAQEQWLQYRYSQDARSILPSQYKNLQLNTKAPADVDLPKFTAEPLFTKWTTPMRKQGFLWIALDRTTELGPYDRVYIDSNGNGSLADETPVSTYRKESKRAYFKPAKLIFEIEDGPVTYHLGLQYYSGSSQQHQLICWGAGWYEGKVTVDAQSLFCRLLDFNSNGTFDDRSDTPNQADHITLGEDSQAPDLIVGKYISVSGGLYNLEIAQDGAFVKLNPAQDIVYGRASMPETISSLDVFGSNGHFIQEPQNRTVRLPVGTYRIKSWAIERKHSDDSIWHMQGDGLTDQGGRFTVSADSPTTLRIGEPIISSLTMDRRSSAGHSFGSQLRGRSGEQITLTRNSRRPTAPKLHVVNKAGTYERNYQFEYG